MSDKFDLHNYDDIIHMPHHTSPNRRRMTNIERGAQFSPFAALTGYEAAVEEAAGLTDEKRELSEDMKAILDAKLQILAEHLDDEPIVTITYFVPDNKKAGGSYVSTTDVVKTIDEYERCVVMMDRSKIFIEQIRGIEGDILNGFDIY